MSILRRAVESDPSYLEILESLTPEEQEIVAKETNAIIESLDSAFDKLAKLLEQDEGPDKFIQSLKDSLDQGVYNDNEGVSPLLWPEKS